MPTQGASRASPVEKLEDSIYRTLFESGHGLYAVLDRNLQIVAVTNAYLKAFRKQREDLCGRPFFEVFPGVPGEPDAPKSVFAASIASSIDLVHRTGRPHDIGVRRYDVAKPDGSGEEIRYWSLTNTPILDPSGDVNLIVHGIQDVTDIAALNHAASDRPTPCGTPSEIGNWMGFELARRLQEILRAQERLELRQRADKQLQEIIEAIPDGVLVTTAKGEIVLANAQIDAMFGYDRSDLLGRSIELLLATDPMPEFPLTQVEGTSNPLRATLESGARISIKRKDGTEFPAHITLNILFRDDGQLVIYSVRDVTSLQRAEEAIRETEEQYRNVLDNMLEGAQILSFDWHYLYLNEAAAKFCREPREAMIGGTVMEWFPGFESTKMFAALDECMRSRDSKLAEFEFMYPNGSVAWFVMSIQPIPQGLFILSLDVTERKMADLEIRQLNESLDQKVQERTAQLEAANQELESFAYSVSHDLRSPLRHIHGYAEMLALETNGQLSEKGEHYVSTISAASSEMEQLIDDLLSFSKMGRVEIQRRGIRLDELVKESIQSFKLETEGRKIVWKIEPLPCVEGDASMLKLVLTNLIGNAIKYSRQRTVAEIEIGSYVDSPDTVAVYVRDNGAGFDMKYAHKLFGVFQRLHHADEFEGTGIGLAIVRRIVSRHGGRTWAEARLNEGATFFFTLRLANSPSPPE